MILLIYFDKIIGPKAITSKPENLIENLKKENLYQIVSLLDTGDEGFFAHEFSPELRTANWIFRIPSDWARGSIELVMLTVIVQKEIELKEYQLEMEKFIDEITLIDDLFKAFYINNPMPVHEAEIKAKFNVLNKKLDKLYKILSLKSIETEGTLTTLKDFKESKTISIPKMTLMNLEKISENKKDIFIVYRVRGDSLKIDAIPVTSREIFKLEIIFGVEMTPTIIKEISDVFSEYEISLVFSSGICQEAERCIYEVYVELLNKNDLETLKKEIYEIEGILDIQIEILSVKN
jgi:hypothetical protein